MASDQVVTPAGEPANPNEPAPRPAWRGPTTAVGWIVGVLTLLIAVATIALAKGYPASVASGWALLVPGVWVLPPVVGLARRQLPMLGSLWAPPLIYVLLTFAAFALGAAVEPHGAARQPYVNRALAAADTALKANDPQDAAQQMAMFGPDAATNPAVKAMLARIAAARAAQGAAREAAAQPTHEQTLAELRRVDATFQAMGAPCKQALTDLDTAFATGPVAVYQLANAARHACPQPAPTASDAVPQPARDKLNADVRACQMGYARIWAGLGHVRGLAKKALNIKKAIAANDDLAQGRDLVNACLPTYEADLAAAGLKRPAPDLAIGPIPYID